MNARIVSFPLKALSIVFVCGAISISSISTVEAKTSKTAAISAPVPGLVTMHVSKRFSRSQAIAQAQAKYPGYKFAYINELTNVWVVVMKN